VFVSCVCCPIPPAALLFGGTSMSRMSLDQIDSTVNEIMERITTTTKNTGEWLTDERRVDVSAGVSVGEREQNEEKSTAKKFKALSAIVDILGPDRITMMELLRAIKGVVVRCRYKTNGGRWRKRRQRIY